MKYRGAKIFGVAVLLAVMACVGLRIWAEREFGKPYYIKDHDPVLESHAAEARPVIEALEKYRLKNGEYPRDGKAVIPWFVTSQMSKRDQEQFPWNWEYFSDGKSYSLAYRLSHDEDLIYKSEAPRGEWIYDSGQGTPRQEVKLGP